MSRCVTLVNIKQQQRFLCPVDHGLEAMKDWDGFAAGLGAILFF
jgi:hypothetical protein